MVFTEVEIRASPFFAPHKRLESRKGRRLQIRSRNFTSELEVLQGQAEFVRKINMPNRAVGRNSLESANWLKIVRLSNWSNTVKLCESAKSFQSIHRPKNVGLCGLIVSATVGRLSGRLKLWCQSKFDLNAFPGTSILIFSATWSWDFPRHLKFFFRWSPNLQKLWS